MGSKKYDELANRVIDLVGGKDNISYFTHCVTRLRFNLKDKGLANKGELDGLSGVIGTQWSGDQLQIIVGQQVGEVYAAICDRSGLAREDAIDENLDSNLTGKRDFSPRHMFDLFFDTLSGIFAPFIPAIVSCGLLQGVLYSIQTFGWISADSVEYNFFYTCANTAFYFMPVLIAFSAGKRFKCNPYVAAALGAVLIHPTFTGMSGETIELFGVIPITFANYSSTVVPAILTVYVASWIERACKKVVPAMLDIIVTPFATFLVAAIIGFSLLAPAGNFLGTFVAEGILWLYTSLGPVGGAICAAVYPFMLATGMQVAMSPITVQNLATLGYDFIYPCTAASNAAMAACALYIFFTAKNKNIKSIGSSTGVTALIGVTEPVFFGLIAKYRKAMIATIIGGAAGGVVMGLFTVQYLSFGFVPFGTLPLAMTETFPYYMIGVCLSMVVAVISMRVLNFTDEE